MMQYYIVYVKLYNYRAKWHLHDCVQAVRIKLKLLLQEIIIIPIIMY